MNEETKHGMTIVGNSDIAKSVEVVLKPGYYNNAADYETNEAMSLYELVQEYGKLKAEAKGLKSVRDTILYAAEQLKEGKQ